MLKATSTDDVALNHEFNMTLTAVFHLSQVNPSDNLALYTFIDKQLRGVCPLQYNAIPGENMAFAMIYGDRSDIGKPVEIVLHDNSSQEYITLTGPAITFEIDQIRGTPVKPVIFATTITGQSSINQGSKLIFEVYPNPFTNKLNINYSLHSASHVTLSIFDASGREISRMVDKYQVSGVYTSDFEASGLLPGIYFCTLKTGDSVETLKIIHLKQ